MPQTIASFFRRLFDLREGAEEKSVIIENIKDDAEFTSARLWTLVFAIGVASIGLNINSIPVVIGAMLISPLMGPIVSAGLSLAIHDGGLLRRSVRNFLIQTIISIAVSALYFSITPITNAQSELLARTQPTIFDIIIALFGGLAGFIGVSRSKHSNVIPGVAIATALMPPLCTVGYGIATTQTKFVFGALYLFLINSMFICLASLVISRYLRLPWATYADLEHQRRTRRLIASVTIVITLPAIFLAYSFVEDNHFQQNIDRYVQATFEDRGYLVVYKKAVRSSAGNSLELAFVNDRFSRDQIQEFEARMSDFGLANTTLSVRQNDGFALTEEDWQLVLADIQGDDERVIALEAKLASEQAAFTSSSRILSEVRALDPRIMQVALGTLSFATSTESVAVQEGMVALVYLDVDATSTESAPEEQVDNWFRRRLKHDTLVVYRLPSVLSESN